MGRFMSDHPREPITNLPRLPNGGRMETGPLQFGDDWPGVFIRGDEAIGFANILDHVIPLLPSEHWPNSSMLAGLRAILRSCWVGDTGWPPGTPPA